MVDSFRYGCSLRNRYIVPSSNITTDCIHAVSSIKAPEMYQLRSGFTTAMANSIDGFAIFSFVLFGLFSFLVIFEIT